MHGHMASYFMNLFKQRRKKEKKKAVIDEN
jgi:hypothetical protein